MPNQIPFGANMNMPGFGPFAPNMNIPGFENSNNNAMYKLNELEERLKNLEDKVTKLEQKVNTKNEYDYQTSMHMM